MAGAVVDRLEAVDVEPDQPELDPDPGRARDFLAQLGVELAPVRKTGQRIEPRGVRELRHQTFGPGAQPAHDHTRDEQAPGQHRPLELAQLDLGAKHEHCRIGEAGDGAADHRPAELEEIEGRERDPEVEERVGSHRLGPAEDDRQDDEQVAEHRRDPEQPKRQPVVGEYEQGRGQVRLDGHPRERDLGAPGVSGEQQGRQRQGSADSEQVGEGARHQRLVLDYAQTRGAGGEPETVLEGRVEVGGQLKHQGSIGTLNSRLRSYRQERLAGRPRNQLGRAISRATDPRRSASGGAQWVRRRRVTAPSASDSRVTPAVTATSTAPRLPSDPSVVTLERAS